MNKIDYVLIQLIVFCQTHSFGTTDLSIYIRRMNYFT